MEKLIAELNLFEKFPELETSRCLLTQLRVEHARDLFEIYGDQETMQYMQRKEACSVQNCKEIIASWQKDFKDQEGIRWGIFQKKIPEKLIGTIALHYWSKKHKSIEIGADLNKNYAGLGIISEVTETVISFAFCYFDINRLELRCDPRNTPAVKIAEKLGFKKEGVLREAVYVEGKGFMDEAVYSLLKKEFNSGERLVKFIQD